MQRKEFVRNFDLLYDQLYRFAFKLTKDENRAKDLMQETAYMAFKNLSKFKPGTNFKAWISTILRNTFINGYRKAKVRKLASEPVDDIMYKVDKQHYTQNQGISNINLKEIERKIDELKSKYKVPFLLHYSGFEYSEIASNLNIPIGTVKSRLFTARKQLQSSISRN